MSSKLLLIPLVVLSVQPAFAQAPTVIGNPAPATIAKPTTSGQLRIVAIDGAQRRVSYLAADGKLRIAREGERIGPFELQRVFAGRAEIVDTRDGGLPSQLVAVGDPLEELVEKRRNHRPGSQTTPSLRQPAAPQPPVAPNP